MASPFPAWLVKRVPRGASTLVEDALRDLSLKTVCRSARCPNRLECFAKGTATFLIMGDVCTRNCRFCAIERGTPEPLDPDEPERVAEAVKRLGLRYAVVTSVTRDDLPDGGASHFADVIRTVKRGTDAEVEVLAPDFKGDPACVDAVIDAEPVVFNHNVETIRRLYARVRPLADYQRSLRVLAHAACRGAVVKSGLMAGLGETEDEVLGLLEDLRGAGVTLLTIGQYLAPRGGPLDVAEFVKPETFERYREAALEMGFAAAACGPFVRSSYRAAELQSHFKKAFVADQVAKIGTDLAPSKPQAKADGSVGLLKKPG